MPGTGTQQHPSSPAPSGTLEQAITRDGPMSRAEAGALARQLTRALAALHSAGLVHGHLDASCVDITADGPRLRGTFEDRPPAPARRPPEWREGAAAEPPWDVHALGLLLTEAVGGDPRRLPRPLHRLVQRCLRPDPAERPTARALDLALNPPPPEYEPPGVLDAEQEQEQQPEPDDKSAEAARPERPDRRRVLTFGVFGLAVVATGVGWGLQERSRKERTHPRPQSAWRAELDSRATSLTVSGDLAWVATSGARLHCVHIPSGRLRWTVPTDGVAWKPPALADGLLYVAGDQFSVFAFDPVTGREVWKKVLPGRLTAGPVPMGDGVVFGTDAGRLHQLHGRTGDQQWTWADPEHQLSITPAARGSLLHLGYVDATVSAFDPGRQQLLWSTRVDSAVTIPPLSTGGQVCLAAGEVVQAVDPDTGLLRWTYDGRTSVNALAGDGTLTVVSLRDGVVTLEGRNGRVLWAYEDMGVIRSAATLLDGVAYLGTSTGLHALDLDTGRLLWTYPLPSGLSASPALTRTVLLVTDESSGLQGLTR